MWQSICMSLAAFFRKFVAYTSFGWDSEWPINQASSCNFLLYFSSPPSPECTQQHIEMDRIYLAQAARNIWDNIFGKLSIFLCLQPTLHLVYVVIPSTKLGLWSEGSFNLRFAVTSRSFVNLSLHMKLISLFSWFLCTGFLPPYLAFLLHSCTGNSSLP